MTKGMLITQCLQRDFVQPIGPFDPLPNNLHVGYEESKRLMGERPDEGPVAAIMKWAYSLIEKDLTIINVRDWHDESDSAQQDHMKQFGPHCLKDTAGAEFVFQNVIDPDRRHHIINASGLNDFFKTGLSDILDEYSGEKISVGIIGVWTDAKISFLAYELATRYPNFEVSVCSALTASASRTMHFIALDQMKNILGLHVFSSMGSFTEFLAGSMPEMLHESHRCHDYSRLKIEGSYEMSDIDKNILLYLYRDCNEVSASCLDGGFSGNVVLKVRSKDLMGHDQVPAVIKIGERDLIAKERIAFERIQEVMGNNAPAIVDFAEQGNRGGIKYRYASMLDSNVQTFQDFYTESNPHRIYEILDVVFKKQLGRLYKAAVSEKLNMLEYYDFSSKYSSGVRKRVEALMGARADEEKLEIIPGIKIPNICLFYEKDLKTLKEYNISSHYAAYLHGDLNGKNIIIDDQENVWLIDFFHTHKGHIIRDLVKVENDLLYIWTEVNSDDEFSEALKLSDLLINVDDIGVPLEKNFKFKYPQFEKAFKCVKHLRSYYPDLIRSDRDPYQLHTALMRYAVHTISFDESNEYQRKWALYSSALCSDKIKKYIRRSSELKIDFIDFPQEFKDFRMGITILPGRKDKGRSIDTDIEKIKSEGISTVVCMISEDEFHKYGVDDLREDYESAGLNVLHLPVMDQGVPSVEKMKNAVDYVFERLQRKESVLVHCVGGLGRSGTFAAVFLVDKMKLKPDDAIALVRKCRSERAIESGEQVDFIFNAQSNFLLRAH